MRRSETLSTRYLREERNSLQTTQRLPKKPDTVPARFDNYFITSLSAHLCRLLVSTYSMLVSAMRALWTQETVERELINFIKFSKEKKIGV